jgi:M6 family metalloprotease-like protein
MQRSAVLYFFLLAASVTAPAARCAAPPAGPALPADLKEFRTVENAVTVRISRAAPVPAAKVEPGYLGVSLEARGGKLVVAGVAADSPAARAGVRAGDVLDRAGGAALADPAALSELVRTKAPGDELALVLHRAGKKVETTAVLTAVSRPLSRERVVLGVRVTQIKEGVRLRSVTRGSSADRAKLKVGDVIVAMDGEDLAGKSLEGLAGRRPGEVVRLTVKRGGETLQVGVTLDREEAGRGRGWDDRQPTRFRKPVYRLAVIPIEYPDVKHNARVSTADWTKALFGEKVYTDRSATGQKVYGSLHDYYQEISCGALRVEGKFFDWVKVAKKRSEYAGESGGRNSRYVLLREAIDLVLARDKKALEGFDGIFFLYAGGRERANRGGLYWPHKSTLTHDGRRWGYFICPEEARARTMASISVIAHEFGHMLGLPDLYARPEVPGEEGLGVWCTMSTGHGQDGKPLHFSAWCKEQMGWLKPAVIDPRTKQKLILGTVKGSTKECYKVLLRADGSEYLLLENRRKVGFDRDLPAEGLLIWRVVDGRPALEESHGIAGPDGPRLYPTSVPYPSRSNNAFTPFTTPSSKPIKVGGTAVYITNIRRLPDGRITFHIGYEYL